MINMNQKGQTFSVFKLLISAIVAIAILTILFNILGMVNFNPTDSPQAKAIDLVKKAVNPEFTIQKGKVQFKPKDTISAKAIENQGTGYKICVSEGDAGNGFDPANGTLISYTGGAAKNASLMAICGSQKTLLENIAELQAKDLFPPITGCEKPATETESVCILTVSKSVQ